MKRTTGNMTVEQMMKLLQVYDAVKDLEGVMVSLLGYDIGSNYEEGIIGRLSLLEGVICEMSPLDDVGEMDDFAESELGRVLYDSQRDLQERAELILFGQ